MDTSEKSGFFLVVVASLLYLGVKTTKVNEPYATFIFLFSALLAIAGGVLLLDWLVALVLRRVSELRYALGQPQVSILSVLSKMNSEQLAMAEKMGVVLLAKGNYTGTIQHMFLSPWGKQIPYDWVTDYLTEVEKTFPNLIPINSHGEGSIERQYNTEFTNWLLLWKLAVRDGERQVAKLVVTLDEIRVRFGLD